MQSLSLDFDIKDYESDIQKFAPMIEKLSLSERFALVKLIMNMPITTEPETEQISAQKNIAQMRFNRFPNVITLPDDFDDYLGDDFWFPNDDILYK